jgi:oxalate---CoA ligase
MDSDDPPHETVEEMAAHYIDEIRRVQPHGPYYIGGHCAGAWPAFEMARQLRAAGETIATLVVVDVEPPGITPPSSRAGARMLDRIRYYLGEHRLVDAVQWRAKLLVQRAFVKRVGTDEQRRVAELRAIHRRAHQQYQGGTFDGDLHFLRSEQSAGFADRDWHLRWGELIDGTLIVDTVPGAHAALVEEASSAAIARALLRLTSRE